MLFPWVGKGMVLHNHGRETARAQMEYASMDHRYFSLIDRPNRLSDGAVYHSDLAEFTSHRSRNL